MARKKMNLTEEKIQALVRAGRGQGEGAEYIPWLQIGDFSSQGRSHRIQDHENGRIHHLFSDLEADYYHILAWADTVRLLRSIASIGSKLTISVICLDTIHLLSSRRLRFRLKTPQAHC